MAVLLPELVLHRHLENCFKKLRSELTAQPAQPEKTWLGQVFGGQLIDQYHYFDEACAVLLGTTPGSRPLSVQLGYPLATSPLPGIHLLLPGEMPGQLDSLGQGQQPLDYDDAYEQPDYDQTTLQPYLAASQNAAAGTDGTLARSFEATFQLLISANTSQQVVLVYRLLQALLVATMPALSGQLPNARLGGQDVQFDFGEGPLPGLFQRNLTVSFSHECRVPLLETGPPAYPVGRFEGHAQ